MIKKRNKTNMKKKQEYRYRKDSKQNIEKAISERRDKKRQNANKKWHEKATKYTRKIWKMIENRKWCV